MHQGEVLTWFIYLFDKKLRSAHGTGSFKMWHENCDILVMELSLPISSF